MAGNPELLRLVDMIHREKDIAPEVLFEAIESAVAAAVHKRYSETDEVRVEIDRRTGEHRGFRNGVEISSPELGRIAAQTAKQVIIQKIREAEQAAILGEYETRRRELVTGQIVRFERDDVIVSLGNGEAVLPRSERVRGENYHIGDRIHAIVTDVKKVGTRVRIVLSRTHTDLIRKLFEREVPEIAEGIIEVKHLAREPGYRTKIAVASNDPKIDCLGACVGVRGSRIRNVIDELNNEKVDIIRWNDSAEVLIMNALKPAEIQSITLYDDTGKAEVVVADDQLSLAIGKKGQNVRLAAKLTGWDINIVSASDASVQASANAMEGGDLTPGAPEGAPNEDAVTGEGGADAPPAGDQESGSTPAA